MFGLLHQYSFVCFSLVYLRFSKEDYEGYEHDEQLCVTVEHDKPTLFNTIVEFVVKPGVGTAIGKLCNHYVHILLYYVYIYG